MKIRKKEFLKIISFIIVFTICIISFSTITFAAQTTNVYQFKKDSSPLSKAISDLMGNALGVVQIAAAGVAGTVLIVLGIKYVTSAPEGKAVTKKAFVYYLIGFTIVSFGASIIGWIAEMI